MEKNEEQSFVHRDILHHPFKNDCKLFGWCDCGTAENADPGAGLIDKFEGGMTIYEDV